MVVLCSTVGRGYSLNKLFSENGRYATSSALAVHSLTSATAIPRDVASVAVTCGK